MTDTLADFHITTFDDVVAAIELREIEHRRPSRAKRLIARCPACDSGGGKDLTLTVQTRNRYVTLRCDNDCVPLEIRDALGLDGALTAPRSPDDLDRKHGNQLRIAQLFAEDYAGKLIHVHGLGWFRWTGRHWAEDHGDKHARNMVPRTLRRALDLSSMDPELAKAVAKCESAAGIAGVLHIAAAMTEFAVAADALDADPYLLNCANGTLDLNEFALRPHEPEDYLTKITEASYDENAVGRTWGAFLTEILPDAEVREYLRRVVGMSLIGRQEQHILPVLTGTGSNGKSATVTAILHALGTYAMAADPNLLTEGRTSSVGQVDLKGTRLAVVSETDKGTRLAESTAKQLTGGDRIKARKLYQDFVEFDPSHTLMMVTNHPPRVSGDDEATWRRISVVKFDVVIPPEKRDGKLPDRLQIDAEAILAWAVQGLADYQVDGLNPPDAVRGATADYRSRSDHLGQFIADQCITGSPAMKVSARELFEAWGRWSQTEDCEHMGRNTFQDAIAKQGGIRVAKSGGQKFFEGIRLRTAVDAA